MTEYQGEWIVSLLILISVHVVIAAWVLTHISKHIRLTRDAVVDVLLAIFEKDNE